RITVKCVDTVPLKEECIENISSSLGEEINNSSEAVEELKYRRSLKIALDILNQNVSPREVPPNTQLSQENNAGSLSSTPLRRRRSIGHSKEKLEPKTSRKKREQKNNPSLKTDTKPQTQKASFLLEESAKAHERGTNPSMCSTVDLYNASNSDSQNCETPESNSLPRQKKIKPGLFTKSQIGNKVSPKENSRQGRKRRRGAGSPLPVPREAGAEVPVRRANTRSQPKRTLLDSSCKSTSDDLEKSIGSESKSLAKQLGGRKQPASLKRVHGERDTDVTPSSYGKRKCRNCPESSSGPSNHEMLSDDILSPDSLSHLSALVDEEEEDEELPSILSHQEPQPIEAGILVWCKLRRYPYWPAVVKNVKRKPRKACVLFIDGKTNAKKKGFSVSLKSLKHFDCEEKQDLIDRAKENYRQEIEWCIRLISDYRIRVGCHSFTGSFLEYLAADISYPVRKEGYQGLVPMAFSDTSDEDEESSSETSPRKPSKKLLPDRTRAARDKANKKIVEFIVKTKGAEEHLLAILKSRKQSRWLKEFLNSSQYVNCIETYLEDEEQLDLVVNYLKEVYWEIGAKNPHQINVDAIKLISDVLLPEAIIYAISALDEIDYKKAEEKYIKGPSVSKR
ncbi:MUM1 protein, partial [Glareola pratincola]|nr:MUM1 protein [Glareola pratincola]